MKAHVLFFMFVYRIGVTVGVSEEITDGVAVGVDGNIGAVGAGIGG